MINWNAIILSSVQLVTEIFCREFLTGTVIRLHVSDPEACIRLRALRTTWLSHAHRYAGFRQVPYAIMVRVKCHATIRTMLWSNSRIGESTVWAAIYHWSWQHIISGVFKSATIHAYLSVYVCVVLSRTCSMKSECHFFKSCSTFFTLHVISNCCLSYWWRWGGFLPLMLVLKMNLPSYFLPYRRIIIWRAVYCLRLSATPFSRQLRQEVTRLFALVG